MPRSWVEGRRRVRARRPSRKPVFVYVPSVVRAGVYARISADREGDRLGVSRQLADCAGLAQRKGWQVADQYVDDDVSAWSGKTRPEYRRLLDDVRAGALDAVIVW